MNRKENKLKFSLNGLTPTRISKFAIKKLFGELRNAALPRMERADAFTLAEVLITLVVIGVVAAVTLPTLVTNIQNRVREKRIENIHQKLSKVTDKMAATSDLRGYASTQAFVEEMKKHMNIAKICDNSHLAECWPTTEVDIGNDKTWEMSKTKTAKTLKITQEGWDDTVGIITADGRRLIFRVPDWKRTGCIGDGYVLRSVG